MQPKMGSKEFTMTQNSTVQQLIWWLSLNMCVCICVCVCNSIKTRCMAFALKLMSHLQRFFLSKSTHSHLGSGTNNTLPQPRSVYPRLPTNEMSLSFLCSKNLKMHLTSFPLHLVKKWSGNKVCGWIFIVTSVMEWTKYFVG